MCVPRLTRFALTTWSITTFTCKYYPFDSSNGFWKINMIQQMVSTSSTLLEKGFYISYLFSRWPLVFSKWIPVFSTWFPEFGKQFLVFSKWFPVFSTQFLVFSKQFLVFSKQFLVLYLANALQNLANGFYLCKKQFLDFTEMANKEANALHNIYIYIHIHT